MSRLTHIFSHLSAYNNMADNVYNNNNAFNMFIMHHIMALALVSMRPCNNNVGAFIFGVSG